MKYKIIIAVVAITLVVATTYVNYQIYDEFYENKILRIVSNAKEQNENIDLNEIAEILNTDEEFNENILIEYGYDINDKNFVNDAEEKFLIILAVNISIFVLLILVILIIEKHRENKYKKEINNIILFLEKINMGIYDLEIDTNSEDDLSLLKNEIYKTTVLLKEQARYLVEEKQIVKNNIVDISHQLKTPLTAMTIMLENIIEDEDMDKEVRQDFIKDIHEKTEKINYLIKILLKLSRFDADVVVFKSEIVNVKSLIDTTLGNVRAISREKHIEYKINIENNPIINGDLRWEEEALTNIIKNAIENSETNSIIEIKAIENNIYTEINIIDYGKGMDQKAIEKIFTRFYKGENSTGVGVGLNLSKAIIEKDNGIISVRSELGKYTEFNIKYMKHMREGFK